MFKKNPKEKSVLTLTDIIEAYKKIMSKMKINTLNETHFYTLVIKLSLNQHGKTWRDTLKYEKKKNLDKLKALSIYKSILQRKMFCSWIESYIASAK